MATGSTMAEMAGCMLAQCVSELVRRDGADWSSISKMVRAKTVCE
jgi:hypothetical protein